MIDKLITLFIICVIVSVVVITLPIVISYLGKILIMTLGLKTALTILAFVITCGIIVLSTCITESIIK